MDPYILKGLLLIAEIKIQKPVEAAPVARVQEAPKRKPGSKADCFPWFPERNYQCPSPKDK